MPYTQSMRHFCIVRFFVDFVIDFVIDVVVDFVVDFFEHLSVDFVRACCTYAV